MRRPARAVAVDARPAKRQDCDRRQFTRTVTTAVEAIDIDAWLDTYVRAIASAHKSSSLAA